MATMKVLLPAVLTLILFSISIRLTNCHNVPVFIWASKSHSSFPVLPPSSHVSTSEFSKDYLKHLINHKTPVVVFIQDRLSLEDLSIHGNDLTPLGQNFKHLQTHLDEHPSLILPSVENPFQVLREIKGHQSIDTLDYNDDVRHALSGSRSDLTLVYLPSTVGNDNRPESLKANDELMSKAVSHYGSKGYIALFTGKEPSWDAASEEASHRRISRSLLEAAPDNATVFRVYAEDVILRIVDPKGVYNMTNVTLSWPPENPSAENGNGTVTTIWNLKPVNDDKVKSFSMELTFEQKPSSWQAQKMTVTYELKENNEGQTLNLTTNHDLMAANGFSFSCGKTTFIGKYNYSLYVNFYKFQIEPFGPANVSSGNASFSDSFHCSTFMTMPLWMGFFTILLFTAILGFGIFMLFQVKTMDRFDDPKGKTISVPQSE